MQEFPGNSQKTKNRPDAPAPDERPKVERITTSVADRRKRGLGRKFKDTFIKGSLRDTADHMVLDVIVPAVKDMVFDAFEDGLQRLIYGESARTRRTTAPSAYSNVGRVNYTSMSKASTAQPAAQRMLSRRARSSHDFGEIFIDSRHEASEVIEQMYEYLSRFGEVKVSDLYTMTGIQSSHVDQTWGWTSLQGTKAVRRGNRWLLDLPEPIYLS